MKMLVLSFTFLLYAGAEASPDIDYFGEIVEECVTARAPGICMETFGFECEWLSTSSDWSGKGALGCNAPMEGREIYFAELNAFGDSWEIGNHYAYTPERTIYWSRMSMAGGGILAIVAGVFFGLRQLRRRRP